MTTMIPDLMMMVILFQVGLFAFDGNEMTWPTQMGGCFKRCLGQWTWKHVEGLMQFIDSLTASEDTIVLRNGVNNALSLLSEQDRQERHPSEFHSSY